MPERIYRDSVHNIINIDTSDDEGRLLVELIDTPEFQRLRRVRQLGLAYFAYQSAEHSRFTHSLGASHLARRILDKLSHKYTIEPDDRTAVRVAALLHDVGHGAFSHVIESILGFHHEQYTIDAVLSKETEIGQVLNRYSKEIAANVASIIRGDFHNIALMQIVSSQLDADRMDYLLRDSLMTGAKYGIYDVEWIIKSIEIDEQRGHLFVSAPGIYAVEDYLQARYYMFRQVYFHRTLRSAEAVLRVLLQRALDLYGNGAAFWYRPDSAFEKVLRGERLSLSEHLSIDDYDVMFYIKQWQLSDDPILSDLATRFLHRRLFTAFDLDMPEGEIDDFVEAARRRVEDAGFDTRYYFINDSGGDAPYYFYTRNSDNPKELIFVEDGFARPSIREISEVSAAVRGLQKGYRIHRICFPTEVKDEIAAFYHG
jgi:HD superfamily phosphohydrolase